ncbi:transcription factor HIVEP3 isoform X2 [Pyxicephalus adspersus]|uniref:transcription factor HIVEP3 isoform X2 n=1 Tax=Pyxicephalus adspersus TaxID=30357 RepID=UPI003B5BCA03
MEPEKGQKSTRKSEEGVRKRPNKGEVVQGTETPAKDYLGTSQEDLLSQPRFPSSLKIAREGPPRRVGRPCKPKVPLLEQLHISKSQTVSPAFMAPRTDPQHGLEGSSWQVVDPIQLGPSKSSSALHTRLSRLAEDPTQKAYVQRPTQVSVKQVDEPHKKEKKPQKPGKYICQYCSRPCAKPSVLQKHIRSHTGERPYPCIPCGFSFKTKSNLYKHRKSHAHRIKAGLASEIGTEAYPSNLEMERLGGEGIDEPSEGESTDSEDETSTMPNITELSPQKHTFSSESQGMSRHHSTSQDLFSLSQQNMPHAFVESVAFKDPSPELLVKSEDTHTIKQKLALRLSERKKASEEQTFLSPGSKGSTESGYFSRSESAEQQISPPNTNAKSYAEIIFGKCGRIGQRTNILATSSPGLGTAEEKTSTIPMSVPRTQVIEHITKLITINEAVVDTSEIDSVKPRRSSLSRRSSIESPKAALYREGFQFDVKSPGSLQLDSKMSAEKTKTEHSFTSHQSHSATETVPLLRSHSMPSSACTISSPHTFRASYSFDDRIVESEAVSHSHMLSSHPRLLKRQPAIELPLGMEYSSEEGTTTSKDPSVKTSDDPEAKETEISRKSRKGGRVKGLIYECNICGARYKKRGNFETHKKYYCSEMQILEPPGIVSGSSVETGKGHSEQEVWSQLPNYKLGPGLELSTLRKRRKEKSLGDDEEPQSAEWTEFPSSSVSLEPCYASHKTTLNLSSDTIKQSTSRSETAPKSDIHALPFESKEKSTMSKEISVIQHTSSFEKSESMEKKSSFDEEDAPYRTVRQPHSSHTLPKLVRQHNIQVPEILVTVEPDKPEAEPADTLKEPEKVEEFQWPQRSQTLAQLPAEKLPPKKKRLRLAEMAQSSGDSSFESTTLTRSPSQDSSISHASSHSVSFDREEGSKPEASSQQPDSTSKLIGHHMLTVPSHHHQAREMRRSASEQTPNVSHTLQVSENRSKSFDYGNLTSSTAASMLTAQERRKCFSIRQTSLSRHVELEPELSLRDWKEPEQPVSSSHIPGKSCFDQSSVTSPAEQQQHSPSSQPKQKPRTSQTLTDDIEKRQQVVSLLPIQPLLQLSEHASELLSSQATSSIIPAQFSLGPISPSVFHTPPLTLQQSLLHPEHLQLPQQLTLHATDVPFRQHSSYLHSSYPASLPFLPTIFMPVHSQFALPLPAQTSERYSQIIPQISPPSHSSSQDYFPENVQTSPHSPLPLESTAQVIPASPEPVVSVVVPVRFEAHMPLYGNAMYTTLSQILVTQSHQTPSSFSIQKINDGRSKGYSLDLSDVLPKEQRSIDEKPFLRVPFPKTETGKYIPLTSSVEGVLGFDGTSSSVGGSKRMLSPAGSLELTMESQQQKRVKEEEDTEEGYEKATIKSHSILEGSRTSNIATVVTQSQSRLESLASEPSATCEQLLALERSKSQMPPSPVRPSYSKSPEKYQSKDDGITVKEEKDDNDLFTPISSVRPTVPQTPVSIHLTVSHEEAEAKNLQIFPTLHTTTNVSWCYLNYVKPNHTQQTDARMSVYSSWCISLYNPNLPGISTRMALSLLRSKQKMSSEIYTTADAVQADSSLLVPSRTPKPKMTEGFKETSRTVEEEKRVQSDDSGPSVKRGEPSRVRIFEGGYKSNEEYVYVRGRGRGKYVCEECGIRCKKPSMLKKHIRTHTDHRPYMCKHCNFAFKTKGNLTKHMKSKAHSKKCQELGLVPPYLSELDAEEGTSEERWPDSDVVEEHQFSDIEDTEGDDDSDEEDDDDEDDSQEEKNPDPSPTTTTHFLPTELRQNLEIAECSSVCQLSPQPLQTSEPLDKDSQPKPFSDLPHRQWSPGTDVGSSRPGPSRRHLQKRESSAKCFSSTGCTSPLRGMSPCHRLTSAREVSPLRCISPQHLSPHRSLSPKTFMSPECGSSPPARHLSPSREVTSLRYPAFRGGLASPPRYPSPGREESHLSKSDAQIHFKARHGVFPSSALPHRASGSLEASEIKKPGPSCSSSRSLCSPVMPHVLPRSGENLFTHLPLHSQHLQRTPYPMIPIGGIQMVQARPSPQPSLLGPVFPGLHSEGPDKEASQQPQERSDQPLRTIKIEEEETRVLTPPSTAPQHSPTPSTYCQTACTPPPPGTPLVHPSSVKEERLEGEG